MQPASRQIVVAGAGIAGLATALRFAQRGFPVHVFERAAHLTEVGAGLQLSPNATRILDALGVLQALLPTALKPEAVVLRKARTLSQVARVPLGTAAEARWGAPYLVAHRADLHSVLLAAVRRHPDITLTLGVAVRDVALHARGVTVSTEGPAGYDDRAAAMLVGADGVWSTVRGIVTGGTSRFTGRIAWRAMLPAETDEARSLERVAGRDVVTAFMDPSFHLVVYPVRSGTAINLVAVTAGPDLPGQWAYAADPSVLRDSLRRAPPILRGLVEAAAPWRAWPLHEVDPRQPFVVAEGVALVGDAAHAVSPFAAQGAAMAIEDAAVLSACVADRRDDIAGALGRFEALRRPRLIKVARRGALNHFTWHAAGPIGLGRDLVLRTLPPSRLAADLDWLYGWQAPTLDGDGSLTTSV